MGWDGQIGKIILLKFVRDPGQAGRENGMERNGRTETSRMHFRVGTGPESCHARAECEL